MPLTKEDLQAIEQLLQPIKEQLATHGAHFENIEGQLATHDVRFQSIEGQLVQIKEQMETHNNSILHLENSVMHELKLLNENLPGAIARHEVVVELETKVENHGDRISALEQKAANE